MLDSRGRSKPLTPEPHSCPLWHLTFGTSKIKPKLQPRRIQAVTASGPERLPVHMQEGLWEHGVSAAGENAPFSPGTPRALASAGPGRRRLRRGCVGSRGSGRRHGVKRAAPDNFSVVCAVKRAPDVSTCWKVHQRDEGNKKRLLFGCGDMGDSLPSANIANWQMPF